MGSQVARRSTTSRENVQAEDDTTMIENDMPIAHKTAKGQMAWLVVELEKGRRCGYLNRVHRRIIIRAWRRLVEAEQRRARNRGCRCQRCDKELHYWHRCRCEPCGDRIGKWFCRTWTEDDWTKPWFTICTGCMQARILNNMPAAACDKVGLFISYSGMGYSSGQRRVR